MPLTFPLDHWWAPAYGKLLLLVGIRTNLCRISPNFLILEDLKPGKLGYFQVQGTSQVHLFRHFLPDSSPRTCNYIKLRYILLSSINDSPKANTIYNLSGMKQNFCTSMFSMFLSVGKLPECHSGEHYTVSEN